MTTQLHSLLQAASEQLAEAGVLSPRADAELLAGHVLGLGRGEIQLQAITGTGHMPEGDLEQFNTLLDERVRRVPLQHLTGRAPFRRLELQVGPGVFIPRPETEVLVDAALAEIDSQTAATSGTIRVVDLGTGSGALAAAIATERPDTEVHAVEISAEAAAWAQQNFSALSQVSVTLHHCDLRDFQDHGTFDVVVSNPPYIPDHMVPVDPEVAEHDPEVALYGHGRNGLQLPQAVIDTATQILAPGGWFIMEHAEVQAEELHQICAAHPRVTQVTTHQDYTGRDRAVSARLRAALCTAGQGEGYYSP